MTFLLIKPFNQASLINRLYFVGQRQGLVFYRFHYQLPCSPQFSVKLKKICAVTHFFFLIYPVQKSADRTCYLTSHLTERKNLNSMVEDSVSSDLWLLNSLQQRQVLSFISTMSDYSLQIRYFIPIKLIILHYLAYHQGQWLLFTRKDCHHW